MTTATIMAAVTGSTPAVPVAGTIAPASTGSQEAQPFGALMAAVQADGGQTVPAVMADASAKPVPVQLATTLLPVKAEEIMPAAAVPVAAGPMQISPEGEVVVEPVAGAPKESGGEAVPATPALPIATAPQSEAPALPGEPAPAPIIVVSGSAHKPGSVIKPHAVEEKPESAPVESEVAVLSVPEPAPAPLPAAVIAPAAPLAVAHVTAPAPAIAAEPDAEPAHLQRQMGKTVVADISAASAPAADESGSRLPTKAIASTASEPSPQRGDGGSEQGAMPSTSFAQSLPAVPVRAAQLYGSPLAGGPVADHQPTVSAQAGQVGHDMGVAIARGIDAGRDTLLVRLDPAEMGRVHVRLSFDHDGAVRVAMSAENSTALDMLRREAGDLGRALSDAGVRSDSQSFRFDGGGGDARQFAQQQRGSGQGDRAPQPGNAQASGEEILADNNAPARALRSAGGLNLII